jgi:hypothetical protein
MDTNFTKGPVAHREAPDEGRTDLCVICDGATHDECVSRAREIFLQQVGANENVWFWIGPTVKRNGDVWNAFVRGYSW